MLTNLSTILAVGGALLLAIALPALRRQRERRFAELEREWKGPTIDVTPITCRLQRVRSDYLSEVRPSRTDQLFHEQLLYAARRAVSLLPFFRHRSDLNHEPST